MTNTMATSASQVWNTTKLLEMNLLHLSLRDLLLSKRVCTWWRLPHEGSEKIQVALFLKSLPNYIVEFDDDNKPHIRHTGAPMQHSSPIFDPFLNMFIHKDDAKYSGKIRLMSDSFINGIDGEDEHPLYHAPEWLVAFHEERASTWRSMVLIQPAQYEYYGWCSRWLDWFNRAGNLIARDAEGVKVGKIHNLLRQHSKYCVNCPRMPYEISRWGWDGEDEVEVVDIDITGWETFGEIERRAMAAKRGWA